MFCRSCWAYRRDIATTQLDRVGQLWRRESVAEPDLLVKVNNRSHIRFCSDPDLFTDGRRTQVSGVKSIFMFSPVNQPDCSSDHAEGTGAKMRENQSL